MPGRFSNIINIACADAFLAGAHPIPGRLVLSGEIPFHRSHAGIDQQQGFIIDRNQGKALQAQVSF